MATIAMTKSSRSRHTLARRPAQGDRPHRRGDASPADGARRDHRPADRRQADAGDRLGVPSGARSRHDAPAGRPPSRHPAARYRREHLAGHHRDLHVCAGAVLGACRPVGRRRHHARLARAFISASRCRSSPHMGASSVVAAVSDSKGDLGLVPAFAVAGGGAWWNALEFDAAPKIIARLPFVDRADHPAAAAGVRDLARRRRRHGDARSRSGASGSPAGARRPRNALGPLAEVVAVPDRAFDGAALLVSVPQGGHIDRDHRHPGRGRRHRCAPRPSSAATRPAIGSPAERRPARCPPAG